MRTSRSVAACAVAALLSLPLLASPAVPAKPPAKAVAGVRTVLVIPFAPLGDAPAWTGVAAAETVLDGIIKQNQDSFLTLKQLDSVLRRRDLALDDAQIPPLAFELARALGATELITGTVTREKGTFVLEARRARVPGGEELKTARVAGTKGEALPALLHKLTGQLTGAPPKTPLSKDAAALEATSRCATQMSHLAIGPRARTVVPAERLKELSAPCVSGAKADGSLALRQAWLAVALALRGDHAEARKLAASAQSPGRYVPMATLAEWFAARRAQDAAGARAVPEAALKAHPGFLHALGYLGEDRQEAGDEAGALEAWNRYLARSPGHPFAAARAARSLARLGKKDEAITVTLAALDRSPDDPELLLELAARHIDAGHAAEAEKLLIHILELRPARPLANLRLGYLYLNQGKNGPAREQFQKAIALATRPDEARVRALAHADLAQVAAREDQLNPAIEALWAATREGMRKLPCDVPELAKWKGQADLDSVCKAASAGLGDEAIDDEEIANIDLKK